MRAENAIACLSKVLKWRTCLETRGEFIVIAVNESEENIFNFVVNFKEELKSTLYYCSVGYAYRSDKNSNVDELFKISEQEMYKDKADFYKTGKIERRKNPTSENN